MQQRAGQARIARAQAAQTREAARLLARFDVPEHEEQRGAEEAVRDDVDDRAAERDRVEAEDRDQDQARDARASEYATIALRVVLRRARSNAP